MASAARTRWGVMVALVVAAGVLVSGLAFRATAEVSEAGPSWSPAKAQAPVAAPEDPDDESSSKLKSQSKAGIRSPLADQNEKDAAVLRRQAMNESNEEQMVRLLCKAADLDPTREFRKDCDQSKAALLASDRQFLEMALAARDAGEVAKKIRCARYVSSLDPELHRRAEELLSMALAAPASATKPDVAPRSPSPSLHNPQNAASPARPAPKADDPSARLDEDLRRLHSGRLAYYTPEQMKMAETAHIVARVGSDEVALALLQEGMLVTKPTSVTSKMKMTLKSADFDIAPLSSEEQMVAGKLPTTWAWDIVPKHSGKLRLHLAAIIELDGLTKDFTTVDREIAVKVTPADLASSFMKGNWQWIIATLTALTGGGWKLYSARKNRAGAVSSASAG